MDLAYKKNGSRKSPALKFIEELTNLGPAVQVYDPLTPLIQVKAGVFISAGELSII